LAASGDSSDSAHDFDGRRHSLLSPFEQCGRKRVDPEYPLPVADNEPAHCFRTQHCSESAELYRGGYSVWLAVTQWTLARTSIAVAGGAAHVSPIYRPHLSRAGVVSEMLPKAWAVSAAYGDLVAGLLAIIASMGLAHAARGPSPQSGYSMSGPQ